MAKAVARCTCKDCGKEFVREAKKYNRKEADAWKEWAERTFTQCSSCYGKAQRALEMEKPPTLTVSMTMIDRDNPVLLSWSGNTLSVKDTLKELGYVWGDILPSGFLGALDFKYEKGWHITTNIFEVNSWIEKSKAVPGMELKMDISEIDMTMLREQEIRNQQIREEKVAEINRLGEKPRRPECYPTGRWNGRFYGKSGAYRIYVDNKEVYISDEEVESLKQYQKGIAAHNAKVKEIEERYK